MLKRLRAALPKRWSRPIRGTYERWRLRWIRAFHSYGPAELVEAIRVLGVREGDTVFLHSSFRPTSGFRGRPGAVADALLEAVGPTGNLVMPSMPYGGSSLDYLRGLECFDVRRAPSRMGLISEFFRRRQAVLRSVHPTHPVLAQGPKAAWLVDGHGECVYGCGPGSPFEKGLDLDAKVVFFDAGFDSLTFIHWLEHRVKDLAGLTLYHEPPFRIPVIQGDGSRRDLTVYAFSQEAAERRRPALLEAELRKRGLLAQRRVGNTTLMMARFRDILACVDGMAAQGRFFYAPRA